jgi:NAD+ synthase (glutamine-hydrolysing)
MNINIAVCQMEVVPGRPDINTKIILDMIAESRTKQAEVVIFPEMCIPGYLLGDIWEQTAFLKDCENYGQEIIAASNDLIVIFGNVAVDWDKISDDGRVRKYNACFVAYNGKLLGGDNFPHPFRIKLDDEQYFYSLRKLAEELGVKIEELMQPVYLNYKGGQLGLGCTINYPINPIQMVGNKSGVDLNVNISSLPFTLGKTSKRHQYFSQQARETKVPLVSVNNVGMQNNGKTIYSFDGSSAVYNSLGELIHILDHTFEQSVDIINIDIADGGKNIPPIKLPAKQEIEHIYQALHYAVKKFTKAIGINKVVIGISGGIDSAVTAALYAKALGPENILLVNMPSKYNSATTKDLAATLADRLGAFYTVLPIQQAVDLTINQIENTAITKANEQINLKIGQHVAENIQARDRSARLLAAVAAAFGGGFTCNANKTEMTVGYSTLYGDQAGFLVALGDLWKHQVYQLAAYLNEHVYQREVIPQGIIDIVPSAELSFDQAVDEGKGDPIIYNYHDYLFRAFIEVSATPEDILRWYSEGVLEEQIGCEPGLVSKIFSSAEELVKDLERWWSQFTGIGLAKRIQAPPLLAISNRAYGEYRESQNGIYYTKEYQHLKGRLLGRYPGL